MDKTGHLDTDARAVLTKAVLRSAERLGLNHAELAQVLGKNPATISLMANNCYQLDEHAKEWELATLLVRLYGGLVRILAEDEVTLRSWMRNPNADLRAMPIQRIATITGLVETVSYVDANCAHI